MHGYANRQAEIFDVAFVILVRHAWCPGPAYREKFYAGGAGIVLLAYSHRGFFYVDA
jgi:hypothetical protein